MGEVKNNYIETSLELIQNKLNMKEHLLEIERMIEDGGHEIDSDRSYGLGAFVNGIKLEWHISGKHIKLGYGCSQEDYNRIADWIVHNLDATVNRSKSNVPLIFSNPTIEQFKRVYDHLIVHDIELENPQRVRRGRIRFNSDNIFLKAAELIQFCVDRELPQVLGRCAGIFDSIDEQITIGKSLNHTLENSYREHIVPCDFLIREAVVMYRSEIPLEDIATMFEDNCKIVLITPKEAKRLDAQYKIDMPNGWKIGDPITARIDTVGISYELNKKLK